MFGMFGKSKYLKKVYQDINFFINKAGCPRTTKTLETIKEEVELNSGKAWDEKMDWHLLIGEQIHQIAWHYRDYLYKEAKLDTNQAAIFCISEFISNKANKGDFEQIDLSNQMDIDFYDSCKQLWILCGSLAFSPATEKKYANVVIVPRDGNPFKD
jgi:hypothetical protein|tara:strand:+ start:386 stop:853 length:468 start_codon:yes stop_codon:yes gene_type:complete